MSLGNFYSELKRRNVIRAAIAYVAVSWVALQAVSVIAPIFEIDQANLQNVLILLIIGFIPWIVFAWIYEYTGSGFRKTEEVPLDESIAQSTGRRMNAFIIASLSIAVVLLLLDRWYNFTGASTDNYSNNTIAVLPFENMSGTEDNYFSKGISEDILTKISAINDLRVLSRFTIREYDYSGKTPKEIGKDLKVANLLAGNVRRSGNELRIGCQLINTADETEIWAHTFDRELENIFAIQSAVADQVALFLKAELSENTQSRIDQIPTDNLTAYNFYLRGRDKYNSFNGEDNEKSIVDYKLALEEDPQFGLAMAALSGAYSQAVTVFSTRPYSYLDTALMLAERSNMLAPESPETWNAIGLAYDNMGLLEEAKTWYIGTLEIDPNNSTSLSNLALILKGEGQLAEAAKLQKKSLELNPLYTNGYLGLSSDYRQLGLYDEALKELNTARSLDPDNWITHYYTAYTLICKKSTEESRPHITSMLNLDTTNLRYLEVAGELYSYFDRDLSRKYYEKAISHPSFDARINFFAGVGIGYHLWEEGLKDSANVWLSDVYDLHKRLMQDGSEDRNNAMVIASIHSIRGENKQALSLLEEVPRASMDYVSWVLNPMSSSLQDDPAFLDLIEREKTTIEQMRDQLVDSGSE